MSQSPIATAADYADAMLIARRAKNWLVGILLGMLVVQLALFFVVRYGEMRLRVEPAGPVVVGTVAAQAAGEEEPETGAAASSLGQLFLQYLIGLIDFLGVVLALVLVFVVVLLLVIMLVGRLIGVAPVMAALIGSFVLAVLLFPWQAFLNHVGLTMAQADFKVPGVLYTYAELAMRAKFPTDRFSVAVLGWARFVGFPVLAVVVLLWIHLKSRRGLRLALGEIEPGVPEPPGV